MKLQYPLAITLFFSMGQGKNHYTATSIDTIIENLAKYHHIHIERRWTFKGLQDLTDKGFIRRKKRYTHDSAGHISQIPSLIMFTLKGMAFLAMTGIAGARKIYRTMLEYLNRGDKRWPSKDDFDDGSYLPENPHDRKRLKRLLGIVGNRI